MVGLLTVVVVQGDLGFAAPQFYAAIGCGQGVEQGVGVVLGAGEELLIETGVVDAKGEGEGFHGWNS